MEHYFIRRWRFDAMERLDSRGEGIRHPDWSQPAAIPNVLINVN